MELESGHVIPYLLQEDIQRIEELKIRYLKQDMDDLKSTFKGHAKLVFARVRAQAIHQLALHKAILERTGKSPFQVEEHDDGLIVIAIQDYEWGSDDG